MCARWRRSGRRRTMESMTSITQRTPEQADAQARAVGVAATVAALGALAIWLAAEGLRAADFPERRTKGWCSLIVAIAAVVQFVSMTLATRAGDPGQRLKLTRVHRASGGIALTLGAFVTYLCFSFPYRTGATLHRVTGFAICLVVLAKFSLIRSRRHVFAVIALLGVLLVIGFQIAFFTKGWSALRGRS